MTYDPYKALYLHVPFCVGRCGYCDFATSAVERDSPVIDEYVESLVMDVRRASKEEKLGALETVYIGGGTPSFIGMGRLSMLLYALSTSVHLTPEVECTMEANPESLTASMVRDIWALGVNRLSLGVQSFDDEVLRILGRAHDAEAARTAVRAAQERFENVSVDLMCGIPGQSEKSFAESVREAVGLGVTHVSVYPLTIEPHTPFDAAVMSGAMAEPDEDVEAACMEAAARILESAGFHRYEVASYAKPGFESRHNTAYWTGKPYMGIGRSAVTMTQNECRRMRVQDGRVVDDLDARQMASEDLMLGMRMARGVSDEQVARAAAVIDGENGANGTAFSSAGSAVLAAFDELASLGLAEHRDGRWRPTETGWLCGNELYGRLLDLAP
ncbi:radical SAM family heme chaperone HemW [Adlercreutzia sp. R21]|uniref:radical SAM family heme chaperone HemW n=1 Tax=Adlercreutzia wanghongyangiae TaxID=3111451 RepID=UPI002DBC512B|nr:radical SAM family heme chaperone HemW [Adlercreutzia sp. R21]MEC4184077.1 radical SAM family heme chaperone HemW [Adlercreutzia sp. R21]